ncbi:DUF881 domain-containing protein [Knoellia sp. Soil729]|uniref:DUF881 domain-containing protein n=1 Tax=Knoellia sp. Soil729 TaxID=1736394 RepID=UPI0006FFAF9E|nr:DUF881 domain-containing protein [Knoellia sp. Soil729]KRE42818.1 hypothetical protein ASG74_10625 [Knoellia sp. Soil729]
MVQRKAFLTARPSPWSVAVPVVAVLAGVLFATSGSVAQGRSLRSDGGGLPDIIREKTQDNARMTGQLQRLTAEVDQLTHDGAPGSTAIAGLESRAERLVFAAGRTAVQGPGVGVALDDSSLTQDELPEGFGVDDIVVHQQDVQAVVNAFWAGGAEAMMIQDQRIIATSAIRCVGNTLILQGRVYSPPYRIRAIGDPDRLRDFLRRSPEVQIYQEYVKAVGLGYEVRSYDRLEFPAYAGSITPEHATAVPKP